MIPAAMPKIASITLDQMQQKWGWDAERPELLWLRKLDGAAGRFKADGLITAAEVQAGLLRPRKNVDQPLLSTTWLVEARKLLAMPVTYEALPKELKTWAPVADLNTDGMLSNDELSTLVENNPGFIMSDQRMSVLTAQIAALSQEKTDLSWMGDVENRRFFRLMHDSGKRTPKLVSYRLSASDLLARRELLRTERFRGDSGLPKGTTAIPSWYDRSGYDMGHLMPADDYSSAEAMDFSFLMSNMAPQTPKLNQHVWGKLEDGIRDLVRATSGAATVSTGVLYLDAAGKPLKDDQLTWIGPDKDVANGARRVAVPTHFYKAVLVELPNGSKHSFAYMVPNDFEVPTRGEAVRAFLDGHRLSVSALEKKIGAKLFGAGSAAHKRATAGLEAIIASLGAKTPLTPKILSTEAYDNIAMLWPVDLPKPV